MSPRRVAKALAGLGAAALAVIIIAAVWIVNHRGSQRAMREALGVLPGTLLHAHNFHWTQMKGDDKQWELRAREASYANDRLSLKLVDAELSMKLDDGKDVQVRAPRAELKLAGNHVSRAELSGGLKLRYGDTVMDAADLVYLPDQDEMHSDSAVHIEGAGFKVDGVGLKARPRARLFSLQSQVISRFTPEATKKSGKS
jgi:LPS export ABC transporter protein LptC